MATPEPTWSQVAAPANATPPPGIAGAPQDTAAAPGADGIKAQVVRSTPDQPGSARPTANHPTATATPASAPAAPSDAEQTQVIPAITDDTPAPAQPAADAKPADAEPTTAATAPAEPSAAQSTTGTHNPAAPHDAADANTTQAVPSTADQDDPGKTQAVPATADAADPGKTQAVPSTAPQADPGKTQTVPSSANQDDPGKTQVVPGNAAESTEVTQVIPKITDAPKPPTAPAQPQAAAAPQPVPATQPEQPQSAVPKFPPAPPRPANQLFPPGVPIQAYAQQHHTPAAATAVPAEPPRPPKTERQRVGTTSPSGLVVGLLGVLISAVLTYAFDLIPGPGGFQLAFSLGKAGQLLGNLGKIGDFPLWQAPLAVLLPLLPVAQLVLVLVLSVPRTRLVGRRLMSTARLAWIIVLAVIAAYQIIVAVASAGDGGTLALLALFLIGNLIVLIALLFPHWPRDEAAPHPGR